MLRYYFGLDAVRFISALAVCVFHLGFYAWASDYSSMANIYGDRASLDALTPLAWLGWIGVEVFFVISGFVIANSANGARPFDFLQSRLIRLWPAAWICATLTLIVRLSFGEDFWNKLDGNYVRSLVLWPTGGWVDGVYWSLGVEITFYALVMTLLLVRGIRHLGAVAWGLTLFSAAFVALGWLSEPGQTATYNLFATLRSNLEFLPIRYGAFFAVGIWIWIFANRLMTPLTWIGLAMATCVCVAEIELHAWEVENIEAVASAGEPLFAPALVWLIAVAFIFASVHSPDRFAPRSDRARAGLRFAGKITYPLYLVHSVVGAGVMSLLIDQGVPPYLALVAAVLLVLITAGLVAAYLEPLAREPLRRGLNRIGQRLGKVRALSPLFRQADSLVANGAPEGRDTANPALRAPAD